MSYLQASFVEQKRVKRYLGQGPRAFAPGHSGMLQMTAVLLAQRAPKGQDSLPWAGGSLEIRYLTGIEPGWTFIGVDPAATMLNLARTTAGTIADERLTLIEGPYTMLPRVRSMRLPVFL